MVLAFGLQSRALALLATVPSLFLALYATIWPFQFLVSSYIFHERHDHPGHLWIMYWVVLAEIVGTVSGLSLYAAIRYGLRERTMHLALAWAAIGAAAIYFGWQPIGLAGCMGAALCFLTASMWTSKRRMESAIVLVAVAIYFMGSRLVPCNIISFAY